MEARAYVTGVIHQICILLELATCLHELRFIEYLAGWIGLIEGVKAGFILHQGGCQRQTICGLGVDNACCVVEAGIFVPSRSIGCHICFEDEFDIGNGAACSHICAFRITESILCSGLSWACHSVFRANITLRSPCYINKALATKLSTDSLGSHLSHANGRLRIHRSAAVILSLILSAGITNYHLVTEWLGRASVTGSLQAVTSDILTIPDAFIHFRPAFWAQEVFSHHDISEWLHTPVIYDLIDVVRRLIAVLCDHFAWMDQHWAES